MNYQFRAITQSACQVHTRSDQKYIIINHPLPISGTSLQNDMCWSNIWRSPHSVHDCQLNKKKCGNMEQLFDIYDPRQTVMLRTMLFENK